MRSYFLLSTCLIGAFVHADDPTFSLDRLKAFYDEFLSEERQVLASVNLTNPFPASYWVSPTGNDASPGTQRAPFLTLQRARDAVRELPSSARKQDIYIYIEDGIYRMQEPLELSAVDSGQNGNNIIYTAVTGAHPIISGAVQVSNWTLHDPTLGIYSTPIGSNYSRQLYVNGTRATRAQTTPYPAAFLPSLSGGGIEFIPDLLLNPYPWYDPSTWTNPQDIEAVIISQWKMMRVPVQSITPYSSPNNGLITMQTPAWDNANVYYDINTNMPGEWSFWQVTRFENAYEFLLNPGQWYLDRTNQFLYYIPLAGQDINAADVELPILEALVVGQGTLDQPVHNIRFEGLTFSYATWLAPSGSNGYVSDQSAQLLVGFGHTINYTGHDPDVVPTPGNIAFSFANNIVFYGNIFEHLGAVGLQFDSGCSNNTISSNLFTDISSSAIELGAVRPTDSHPNNTGYLVQNNLIINNLISSVAREYVDSAGIFVGFTSRSNISYNTITDVPWSGVAIGWGWGLLDPGSFPGIPNAVSGMWGTFDTLTPNANCLISHNNFQNYVNVLWDAGAVYTTGQQGPSLQGGLLIKENVASAKRPAGGSNTIYTDGGTRYVRVESNVSYNNPVGITDYGPAPSILDPLPYALYWLQGGVPYGSDSGGCRTYGDIQYTNNYWLEAPIPANEVQYNMLYQFVLGFAPYSPDGFFAPCPYSQGGISYPTNLNYLNNHSISSKADIPNSLLSSAGVQQRPATIPEDLWVVPAP